MATVASICNLALRFLNCDPITVISESNDRARFMNGVWADVRDGLLHEVAWNFAVKRNTLAAEVDTPENAYSYQYALPADCLRVLQLNDDDTLAWVVEGGKLLTDESSAIIKYIAQITDTTAWAPLFIEAMAYKLAALGAYPLAKKLELADRYEKKYVYAIQRAKAVNLAENQDHRYEEVSNPLKAVRNAG